MDWKFCWIVSMIFVILFKISQLESKSKENQEDNVKETKEYNTYEIPEELRNMSFNEQGYKYEELNKLHEELHKLETQIRKQKQDMFNGKW